MLNSINLIPPVLVGSSVCIVITYCVRVWDVGPPECPVVTAPRCRVEDLGSAAHSVAPPHGPGTQPAHPVQLVLPGVVHPVVAPGEEEHLPVAVQGEVHLYAGGVAQDEVTRRFCLRL